MGHISRRDFLSTAAGTAGTLMVLPSAARAQSASPLLTPGVPGGIATYAQMGTLPGKKPLIQLADRPPNYEAPLEYLRTPITPNDEFFVRYHLADIPDVNVADYKIKVDGDGANGSVELTLDDLKKMPTA